MRNSNQLSDRDGDDRVLGWTMRIVGFVLAALSLVFITQDIFQGTTAAYFFALSASLGVITLITSWIPAAHHATLQESRVRERSTQATRR